MNIIEALTQSKVTGEVFYSPTADYRIKYTNWGDEFVYELTAPYILADDYESMDAEVIEAEEKELKEFGENRAVVEIILPTKKSGESFRPPDLRLYPRIQVSGKMLLIKNFTLNGGIDNQNLLLELPPHSFVIRTK